MPDISPTSIAERVVESILAQKLAPGERLGEQDLADLFGVSRTLVREALVRLSARGMVQVNSRRGWFVVQPSPRDAQAAFAAREVIETGLIRSLPKGGLAPTAIKRLKQHLAQERAAITDSARPGADGGERSFLLGDFHVCLAECSGNPVLAEILKDLTARTTLIAALYQSTHEARASCGEHAEIVAALEAGDHALAEARMRAHLGSVIEHLGADAAPDDRLASLRASLSPVGGVRSPAPATAPRRRLFTDLFTPPAPSTAKER